MIARLTHLFTAPNRAIESLVTYLADLEVELWREGWAAEADRPTSLLRVPTVKARHEAPRRAVWRSLNPSVD